MEKFQGPLSAIKYETLIHNLNSILKGGEETKKLYKDHKFLFFLGAELDSNRQEFSYIIDELHGLDSKSETAKALASELMELVVNNKELFSEKTSYSGYSQRYKLVAEILKKYYEYKTPYMAKNGWEFVTNMDVDAGICFIGDPCYTLPTDDKKKLYTYNDLLNDFDSNFFGESDVLSPSGTTVLKHEMGWSGRGAVVTTGHGDGSYPILVKRDSNGAIAEVRVVFLGASEIFDEEDYEKV